MIVQRSFKFIVKQSFWDDRKTICQEVCRLQKSEVNSTLRQQGKESNCSFFKRLKILQSSRSYIFFPQIIYRSKLLIVGNKWAFLLFGGQVVSGLSVNTI